MKHIVQFSGGVGSWAAAKRVAAIHGTNDLILLFADTLIEDEDLYRFLKDASEDIGVEVTRIADGRTPWEVFRDRKFIGNSRVDPCSQELKRGLLRKWLEDNYTPETAIVYLGIDWTEEHRLKNALPHWGKWRVEAPLCDEPFLTKTQHLEALTAANIEIPRLYKMGFPHNNCGGFCVKAGQSQFALLYRLLPERYMEHEREEEKLRESIGNYSILTDRRYGVKLPLTLKALRGRILNGEKIEKYEWGGCGCAVD